MTRSKLAVLVVDDVEANLKSMSALLENGGTDVVLARSGEEALRLLLRREFAVMLLDVQMPEMDGYEVAQHARSNVTTKDVPIIFLTASDNSQENVERGYGSGAVDFLFKPVNPTVLRSKVRVFLELYSTRRQLTDAKQSMEQANTVLQQAYTELKETQSQLVQSAKMASLGQLVAGVAHEVNNPLSFSIGHLDTVRRSLVGLATLLPQPLPADADAQLQRATQRLSEMGLGLERIKDLVLKLRTFSRLDEGEQKTVRLEACVESVLTIMSHRIAKEKVEVVTSYDGVDEVDCYPSSLNQALLNLVANAIDAVLATPERSGRVEISAARDHEDRVYVRIRDTGIGLDPGTRERLFEPFYTTKPVGSGTGLGLSITYSIIKKHGGTLALEDAEGGGTTATIVLPRELPRV
ncbi:MAG TPA: hybrid sensor histidine kinase/response regulator [Polyangiaceae bacterium]|nr:hybrid sensor histidine kinase/response regulator [Polyangiaceae bacterium]